MRVDWRMSIEKFIITCGKRYFHVSFNYQISLASGNLAVTQQLVCQSDCQSLKRLAPIINFTKE